MSVLSGECASHFRTILDKYPPQVSSRSAAAAWGCHVHNEVNKSLKKPLFDCSNIGDFYDCGCAEDEGSAAKSAAKTDNTGPGMDQSAGTTNSAAYEDIVTSDEPLKLEQEG